MSHERVAVAAAETDDLDNEAIAAFLREHLPALLAAFPPDEAAARAGLLAKMGPRYLPSIAGLYAFGRFPQVTFPEWGIGCLALAGSQLTSQIVSRQELSGALPELVAGSLAFVHDAAGSDQYPDRVVRELVVNALVHRDLRKPSRVALRVLVDRLEVWSPGGPPEGVSDLEELARDGGVSVPRNPIVASIARRLGLADLAGRGLPLVFEALPQRADRPEIRSTPREVLAVLPSAWRREPASLC